MPVPQNKEDLTKLFRELGARNPEAWASSQVSEGIHQLHRFLFLRQAWARVVSESDDTWIDKQVSESERYADGPYAGVGQAIHRMLAAGVAREDIVDLARGMQAQLLFDICYLLDGPEDSEPRVEDVGWALVETDSESEPTKQMMSCLHESVLNTDPTGREMRPRGSQIDGRSPESLDPL